MSSNSPCGRYRRRFIPLAVLPSGVLTQIYSADARRLSPVEMPLEAKTEVNA
jgi:hypothetical protein